LISEANRRVAADVRRRKELFGNEQSKVARSKVGRGQARIRYGSFKI